jgi:NAD(P)-dependent dehydrogenase (short-subunit alcohol dehydrogenase family)
MKDAPGKVYAQSCDVSAESDVIAAFQWAEASLGGVDILVNCAGIFR